MGIEDGATMEERTAEMRQGLVLAVDDDHDALALLARVLGEEGYQVQPADSGRLALMSVVAHPPDLVLLDVRMPGMDGFEVCRRLRQTDEGRRIPLIFLSASHEIEEWVEGLALGAVDFISKPFRQEELLARVRTHVELGRLRNELETRVANRTAELHDAIDHLKLEVMERQKAEQALRESEQRFRQIANAAPIIIWTSNPDLEIDFRNEYAREFTGLSPQELVCDRWSGVVHPDDLELQRRDYADCMAARQSFQLEYRILRADGEYRHMLDRGTPRILPDGGFAGYVGIIVDLTDVRRSHERALAAQNLENLRVLSAGIAHDFNTLIASIYGETDLALSDMAPGSPGLESVENILKIAKRAAEIVHLLSVYAGDRAENALPELVDISVLVDEIVPHLKPSHLHNVEIRSNLDKRLPSVSANSRQIRQVVLNVIINAVEALQGRKGIVTVSTGVVDRGSRQFVRFEVSDTGSGMNEDIQARVFDPYYSTKVMGRGLGLAAVQGIIRSHGGEIDVRSAPGSGSAFEILLPAAGNGGPAR